jgi:glucose dehydrogenase
MYNQRYSKLNQINKGNVGKMQVAWLFSTGVLRGHEGSPLVVNGMMYIHTPFPNKVFAIDLDTQKIKWRYEPKQDVAVIAQMCCDTVYRGLAYADDKIFLQQADSTLVALDAGTGKVIWSVKNGAPEASGACADSSRPTTSTTASRCGRRTAPGPIARCSSIPRRR